MIFSQELCQIVIDQVVLEYRCDMHLPIIENVIDIFSIVKLLLDGGSRSGSHQQIVHDDTVMHEVAPRTITPTIIYVIIAVSAFFYPEK